MTNRLGLAKLTDEEKRDIIQALTRHGLIFPSCRMVINVNAEGKLGSIEYEKIVLR
ncbi:MAG: hypothetical protein RBT64_10430 [Trichloromonas sp.]|jgi:hypothetical protein|nr:hypothetical protein [Trichloromonas sp.]